MELSIANEVFQWAALAVAALCAWRRFKANDSDLRTVRAQYFERAVARQDEYAALRAEIKAVQSESDASSLHNGQQAYFRYEELKAMIRAIHDPHNPRRARSTRQPKRGAKARKGGK